MRKLAALLLAILACEPEYAYVPVTNATVVAGKIAADYPIPREAPRGDVRLASYGIVDLGSPTDEHDRIRAFHLRMTLIDDGDRAWTVDTREQRLELDRWGTSAAAFVSADAGTQPPVIAVPPKGKRVIDLFFPLPASLQKESQLPSFDAVWRVQADARAISERTPFERLTVEPPSTYDDGLYDYGADYYWGPPYWYNSIYPNVEFAGGVGIPPRWVKRPLYVHRTDKPPHFSPHGSTQGGGHR